MAMPKTKKKVKKAPARRRLGAKAPDYSFADWQDMDPAKFHRHRSHAVSHYYQEYKPADLYVFLWSWMKENGYDKTQIASAKKGNPTPTIAIYAKLLLDGCPDYSEAHDKYWQSLPGTGGVVRPISEFLKDNIEKYISTGSLIVEEKEEEEKEKSKKYIPTIQERIRDQSQAMAEDIDEWIEGWVIDVDSFDPKGFDFKRHFQKTQPTQAHARKMKTFYDGVLADYDELERMPTKGQLSKMNELDADMWEQLKEGYAHIKKNDIKKLRVAIGELMTALDFIIDQAKATRKPRKAKPKSADKLVAKLKFCKADSKYSLASIAPEQIIGANELWVFNTKTRKLGKYVAKNIDPKGMGRVGSGLSVKGTTIIDFDETLSIQKTLRKPPEQLKEFKNAGKVKLRKFIEEIATTDTKLNGRCNNDTILLKVS